MAPDGFPHAHELAEAVRESVRAALAEDVRTGDITAELIGPETHARAEVITRDDGVFCGAPWVLETCAQVDAAIEVTVHCADGDRVSTGQTLCALEGPARGLVTAERTMLNFVQLLSGTATATRRYVDRIAGTGARVLDTRKTVPGLRMAQKYAVHCGGGHNHRMGLFDAFLIKENHLAAAGGIAPAVARARELHPGRSVEVEVENLAELDQALAAGADIALIDNFSLEDTRAAVTLVGGRLKLEASGGIEEATVAEIAQTGVDYISLGVITKKVEPLDLSMRFLD
ncbi:MAG: carboxylating nicotinate-nucleotide diphosphorylase [Pseudomonadales bacterium]|nr:carboxylating nicotinate-nucleotide diphosphorylase [Pseudomonadales bacterium]NIX08953.1 carboxylating nicotinate-nucleotide diphosphorylase [Pseudomonadales bacterium]